MPAVIIIINIIIIQKNFSSLTGLDAQTADEKVK